MRRDERMERKEEEREMYLKFSSPVAYVELDTMD